MKILFKQGVQVHSFVEVNKAFLEKYSEDPKRDLAYAANPRSVVVPYLQENGALTFIDDFNPNGDRLDKAKRFLDRYGDVLKQAKRYSELDVAVQTKFKGSLTELVRGK